MLIDTRLKNNHLIVEIKGRIGGESSIEFYQKVKDIAADNPEADVVLDFKDVDFIDSSGLGSLVAINSHLLKNQRTLILASVPDNLTGLLKITNLTTILSIVDRIEDAIN
jgi:anti-anti-sigma factor